jgi:hypothetical protein
VNQPLPAGATQDAWVILPPTPLFLSTPPPAPSSVFEVLVPMHILAAGYHLAMGKVLLRTNLHNYAWLTLKSSVRAHSTLSLVKHDELTHTS